MALYCEAYGPNYGNQEGKRQAILGKIMPDAQEIILDGVPIILPLFHEREAFTEWLRINKVREPFHPDQHYDYVGAFRARQGRGEGGHFLDTFKLPGHPTFSTESIYYKKGMPAGKWEGEKYVPINRGK